MALDAPNELTGKSMSDNEKVEEQLSELEGDIAELRAAYDQYFLGFERLPPNKKHEAVTKKIKKLKGSFIRQTGLKFRVNNIAQKLSTYERLWDRTLKEIENGTYQRDLFKVKLKKEKQKKQQKGDGADADFSVDEDLDISDLDGDLDSAMAEAEAAVEKPAPQPPPPAMPAIKPLTPPVPVAAIAAAQAAAAPPKPAKVEPPKPVLGANGLPVLTAALPAAGGTPAKQGTAVQAALKPGAPAAAAAKPSAPGAAKPGAPAAAAAKPPAPAAARPAVPVHQPPAPVSAAGGLSDQKVKAIYDAYMMAKRRCGEDTSSLSLKSVSESLRKQVPELMKQHGAKTVDFKVVIKDGKAILRAMPKE